MAQFEPYLYFNGNCAEAMRFYEQTLGAKIEMMMKYSEAPPDPAQPKVEGDAIMHASMTLDGDRLMASDSHPGMPSESIKGMSVSLAYKTADEGRKIFDALSAGGQVRGGHMPRPSGPMASACASTGSERPGWSMPGMTAALKAAELRFAFGARSGRSCTLGGSR